jgi:hypothetical protein
MKAFEVDWVMRSGAALDRAALRVPASQLPTDTPAGYALATPMLFGTLWSFRAVGDQVHPHAHEVGANHFTWVIEGEIDLRSGAAPGDGSLVRLSRKSLVLIPAGLVHSLHGVTAGAQCLNLSASVTHPLLIRRKLEGLRAEVGALAAALTELARAGD